MHFGLVHPRHFEGEPHVGGHGFVRIKRVVLEHHGDVTFGRRQVVDHAVANADGAGGDAFQPRDHAQKRRFAAARRPDQNHKLAIRDIDIHPVHHLLRPVGFAQIADVNFGHASPRRSLVTIAVLARRPLFCKVVTQRKAGVHHLSILTC